MNIIQNEDNIQISIIDDGIGRKKSTDVKTKNQKANESTGMKNIDHRLEILNEVYRSKLDVKVSDLNEDGSGTKVILTLKNKLETV